MRQKFILLLLVLFPFSITSCIDIGQVKENAYDEILLHERGKIPYLIQTYNNTELDYEIKNITIDTISGEFSLTSTLNTAYLNTTFYYKDKDNIFDSEQHKMNLIVEISNINLDSDYGFKLLSYKANWPTLISIK